MSFGFNFNGKGVTRSVNMGGKSNNTVTAAERVAAARLEREAREKERQKQNAATKIQRTFRGSAQRGQFRSSLRREIMSQLEGDDDISHHFATKTALYFRQHDPPKGEDLEMLRHFVLQFAAAPSSRSHRWKRWQWERILSRVFCVYAQESLVVDFRQDTADEVAQILTHEVPDDELVSPALIAWAFSALASLLRIKFTANTINNTKATLSPIEKLITALVLKLRKRLTARPDLCVAPMFKKLLFRLEEHVKYVLPLFFLGNNCGDSSDDVVDVVYNNILSFDQSKSPGEGWCGLVMLETALFVCEKMSDSGCSKESVQHTLLDVLTRETQRAMTEGNGDLEGFIRSLLRLTSNSTLSVESLSHCALQMSLSRCDEFLVGLQLCVRYSCASREALLRNVSFVARLAVRSDGFLAQLWQHVKAQSPMWDNVAATLFLDLYMCFLESAAGDGLEATFSETSALTIEDVKLLIPSLRDHIANLKFSETRPNDAAAISLFNQLHLVYERQPFCEEQVWTFPTNSTIFYTSSVTRLGYDEFTGSAPLGLSPNSKRVLYILRNIPFVIPFEKRVELFYRFVDEHSSQVIAANRGRRHDDDSLYSYGGDHTRIHRGRILEDGYRVFQRTGRAEIYQQARVAFIDHNGLEEAGFGDGVSKEFIVELCKEAFSVGHGLFKSTDEHGLFPNALSEQLFGSNHLEYFTFIGRLLGKAIYEKILIDIPLAKFFRNLLLQRSNTFSDLASYDPTLYRSLCNVKAYTGDVERDLGLFFCLTESSGGVVREIPLIRNGADVPVTNENRARYIHLVAYYRLNLEVRRQINAFCEGLNEVVPLSLLKMFDVNELQMLLQGDEQTLDIADWRANTVYHGYTDNDPVIGLFWRFVSTLTPSQQRELLKFATSVPRAPLLGFEYLQPKFCITKSGSDVTALPSAATCMCQLRLPPYPDFKTMHEKVLMAIQNTKTFELS